VEKKEYIGIICFLQPNVYHATMCISNHAFLVCFEYKCHIINFLLTSLAWYVQRNIGPQSFCTNLPLRARSRQKNRSVRYFSVQTSRSVNKKLLINQLLTTINRLQKLTDGCSSSFAIFSFATAKLQYLIMSVIYLSQKKL
jgi:hypothetical protein